MARIILIETSTALCSTAIEEDGRIISFRESSEPRSHASKTALFVAEMLQETGLEVSDCDAVAVSSGPGSYTGLRVGVSTAKGLCFGAGIPLIAVSTPEILFQQAVSLSEEEGKELEGSVVTMIDARRMEVYARCFKADGTPAGEVSSIIVDDGSFKSLKASGPVLFIGDGAGKCEDVLKSDGCRFVQLCPNAQAMAKPALEAFLAGRFEDTAYFEPFYLKQFVATVSKKNIF